MKKLWNILGVVVGFVVGLGGLNEFDSAVNGIQLFRGLFWLILGMFVAISSWQELKVNENNSN